MKSVTAGRAVLVVLIASVSVSVSALPKFLNVFRKTYAPQAGSRLAQAKCVTCHVSAGPPHRNAYGKMAERAMHGSGTHDLTASVLRMIEAKDADRDGVTNGQEIGAGTLPGDPKSRPQPVVQPGRTGAAPRGSSAQASEPAAAQGRQSLVKRMLTPKHSFHPIIVHFALALFVFGGLLEIYGQAKRRQFVREAGFLNMAAASVAGLVAVLTGVIASYRNGFPFKGTLLIHLILGITAAVGMAAAAYVGYRASGKGRARSSHLYWALLGLALVAVMSAAFFGGEFVYSDLLGM